MKPSFDTRDYEGKKVFIGFDEHKRTYSIVAVCEEVIVKRWSMKAEVESCRRVQGPNVCSAQAPRNPACRFPAPGSSILDLRHS
jgi:hypothetical protein